MDKKTVSKHLREQFFPRLKETGFVRKGDVARRVLDGGIVHVVEVQHLPRSGVFQVNLGAHLPALDGVADAATAAETMREYDCAWRDSIISGFRNSEDAEFAYGATDAEASESVAFLVSEWERQSEAFFGDLSVYPDGFHEQARRLVAEPVHPGHMRTWARVALLVGDPELSRRLADVALPTVPERATALRDDLLALRDGKG